MLRRSCTVCSRWFLFANHAVSCLLLSDFAYLRGIRYGGACGIQGLISDYRDWGVNPVFPQILSSHLHSNPQSTWRTADQRCNPWSCPPKPPDIGVTGVHLNHPKGNAFRMHLDNRPHSLQDQMIEAISSLVRCSFLCKFTLG